MEKPDWSVLPTVSTAHAQFMKMADEEAVGDSSVDILRNIQKSAKELLKIALNCSVGASAVEDRSSIEQDLPLLVAFEREKAGLIRENIATAVELELRERLSAEPLGNDGARDSPQHLGGLRQRIRRLEKEVLSLKSRYHQDMRLLESLQRSEFLTGGLFPGAGRPSTANDTTLPSLVERQRTLVSEILRNSDDLRQLHSDLGDLQKERALSLQHCRELMAGLEAAREREGTSGPIQSTHSQELHSQLQRASARVTLLRHSLQSVVAGSGVDWAQEEGLLELMVSLGRPQ